LKNGNTTINGTTTANSFVKAGGQSYEYLMADGSTSTGGSSTSMGSIGVSSTANGATITSGVLSLTPADGTNGGIVTSSAQTFGGKKTFLDSVVAIGFRATANNISVNAIKVGRGAGTNVYNTSMGYVALDSNTTGGFNSSMGYKAMASNTTGGANTAMGTSALSNNVTSNYNSAFGRNALQQTTAGGNTAMGNNALVLTTTGAENTGVGNSSLYNNTSGSGITALGSSTNVASNNLTNATAIGYAAIVDASNKIQLGNTDVTAVNTSGTYTGAGFVKAGGTSSQYLMADGSTSTGGSSTSVGSIGVSSTANGATISSGVLSLTPADTANAGIVTKGSQSFAGNKTIVDKLGVGTTNITTSAKMEVNSTTQGFLPPRMSAGQRDAIVSPVAGLTIWCSNCGVRGELEVYDGVSWTNMIGGTTAADNTPRVVIGAQTWTTQNLNVSVYKNGDPIPYVSDGTWASLTTGAYCYYNNDSATYAATYGKLYNWYAVTDSRGLAPAGYHIPTDAEWTTLTDNLGGYLVSGGKMKSTGTTLWLTNNTGADNSSGFTGKPGGFRRDDGSNAYLGTFGYFWSSSQDAVTSTNGISRHLKSTNTQTTSQNNNKKWGFSVRCIKN